MGILVRRTARPARPRPPPETDAPRLPDRFPPGPTLYAYRATWGAESEVYTGFSPAHARATMEATRPTAPDRWTLVGVSR